jgi:hypothetical protein
MQLKYLGELEQVGTLRARAGHLAPQRQVEIVGRGRDIAEEQVPPAHGDRAVGVARGQGEPRGRARQHLGHEIAAHEDHVPLDPAARAGQDRQRLVIEEGNANLLENAHGALVDRLHAVCVQRLGRAVDVERRCPGHLGDGGAAAPGGVTGTAAMAPAARGLRGDVCDVLHGDPLSRPIP